MMRSYVHLQNNRVELLKSHHWKAAKAYQEGRDYIEDDDSSFMVYYKIATKVVYGMFENIPCYFHVHAHFWYGGKCYEVGVFSYT